ncbi:universal stress protein [Salinimicrobium marinum]|nr:universal stress protein [Salinimicrobium marinum]
MRKIVVPTDFSENAFNALRYASELFKYEQSEFLLLHAYAEEIYKDEKDLTEDAFKSIKKDIMEASNLQLEKIRKKITALSPNPKHTYKLVSSFGLLVDEVNDLINKENADVAVMGTRGKTNDRKITFGSNTLQVIKYVQSPVLCIPENYEFKTPENILFPTNFLLPYQRRELKLVGEIARKFCAKIHLLHISKFPISSLRQRDNKLFMEDAFHEIRLESHGRDAFSKEDAINKFIDQYQIDLLVMVNSRQTYLETILAPSTIDKISLNPKVPFMVLQNFSRITENN